MVTKASRHPDDGSNETFAGWISVVPARAGAQNEYGLVSNHRRQQFAFG
jgi:hypothetical protein